MCIAHYIAKLVVEEEKKGRKPARGCYYLSCCHCSECVPSAVCPQWQLPPRDVVSALEEDDVNIVIQD